MRRELLITDDAASDLEELHRLLAANYSAAHADRTLRRLLELAVNMARYPLQAAVPAELRELGMADFRQVSLKPYRAIYRVHEKRVIIHLIVDDRRDLQSALGRRLLAPRPLRTRDAPEVR